SASGPDRPEAAEVQRRRRAQLVIASVVGFFDLPNDSICAYIGDGDIAVLKASSTQDLVAWTDEDSPDQPAASWANPARSSAPRTPCSRGCGGTPAPMSTSGSAATIPASAGWPARTRTRGRRSSSAAASTARTGST